MRQPKKVYGGILTAFIKLIDHGEQPKSELGTRNTHALIRRGWATMDLGTKRVRLTTEGLRVAAEMQEFAESHTKR